MYIIKIETAAIVYKVEVSIESKKEKVIVNIVNNIYIQLMTFHIWR